MSCRMGSKQLTEEHKRNLLHSVDVTGMTVAWKVGHCWVELSLGRKGAFTDKSKTADQTRPHTVGAAYEIT